MQWSPLPPHFPCCWDPCDMLVCPRALSSSSVCHNFDPFLGKSTWNLSLLWLTQKFYKAAHLKGAQSTIRNKVLEIKIKNGKFQRDKWKICTFPYSMGAEAFWPLSSGSDPSGCQLRPRSFMCWNCEPEINRAGSI